MLSVGMSRGAAKRPIDPHPSTLAAQTDASSVAGSATLTATSTTGGGAHRIVRWLREVVGAWWWPNRLNKRTLILHHTGVLVIISQLPAPQLHTLLRTGAAGRLVRIVAMVATLIPRAPPTVEEGARFANALCMIEPANRWEVLVTFMFRCFA